MEKKACFKAKGIQNERTVKGFYAVQIDEMGTEVHNILIPDEKYGYFKWVKVDPDTVCRYTGMKDQEGTEIWEKDLCEAIIEGAPRKGEIRFINGCFGIFLEDIHLFVRLCDVPPECLKVISNDR